MRSVCSWSQAVSPWPPAGALLARLHQSSPWGGWRHQREQPVYFRLRYLPGSLKPLCYFLYAYKGCPHCGLATQPLLRHADLRQVPARDLQSSLCSITTILLKNIVRNAGFLLGPWNPFSTAGTKSNTFKKKKSFFIDGLDIWILEATQLSYNLIWWQLKSDWWKCGVYWNIECTGNVLSESQHRRVPTHSLCSDSFLR